MMSAKRDFRVVVARFPNSGIGDHLSCLIGAWYYAKRTGRTLVIDWRGSRFNPDPNLTKNCFRDMFESAPDYVGVAVCCDDHVGELPFRLPIYPAKWTLEMLNGATHLSHTQEEVDAVNALAISDIDRPEPTIVFNQWIHPAPPVAAVREFLQSLRVSDTIRKAADQIAREMINDHPIIAIHIRHGNGENIGHRAAYWLDPWTLLRQLRANAYVDIHSTNVHGKFADNMSESLIPSANFGFWQSRFLTNIAAQVRKLKRTKHLQEAIPVLFCDSVAVAQALKRYLPDLVIPPKKFVKVGEGPLHAISMDKVSNKPIEWQTTFEMMVELELMRRCTALICMDSNFSILTKTELNPENIIHLRPSLVNRLVAKAAALIPFG